MAESVDRIVVSKNGKGILVNINERQFEIDYNNLALLAQYLETAQPIITFPAQNARNDERDFIDELVEVGFEFERYTGPSWKPEDRNII